MKQTRRGLLLALGGGLIAGCTAPTQSGRSNPDGIYTQVYEQTVPSVVQVHASVGGQDGQGSGFVAAIDDVNDTTETLIVTNDHVVPDGSDVSVTFHDGTWADVDVLGTDPFSDLAVLSVAEAPSDATPLSLVSEVPPVGEEVLAIGAPLDLQNTVTQGIISGRNRSLPGPQGFSISDTVQTDAALNPGNSGGPLLTLNGDVAGVVSATGGENIGFAISAALAERVLPKLVTDGSYEHSWLGIQSVDVDPTLAELNELADARGVMVVDLPGESPAEGVLEGASDSTVVDGTQYPIGGDVIRALDGTEIENQSGLSRYLTLETSPGDSIEITFIRDGDEQTGTVELEPRPDSLG
ncbi:S1C family serine protease [Natronocalculus amylovorans]|uniref:Trypsin-like peptidase domain-containing protein n=1 Tax=Natronocalculus amylovorans TaxID=2917812 RepID=A0AAE3FX00_9EURY|nr:trypsin-like peptidase domain-containing protein [Natronocalculus amylovorans]MCL9816908.1 trypsin-like peptidase domain-containing protein [Natronocalculus amylovorans]